MIDSLLGSAQGMFLGLQWERVALGIIVLVIGKLITKVIEVSYNYLSSQVADRQRRFIWKKVIVYSLNVLFIGVFLSTIGVTTQVILGAAGVLTVAIGFAARSSISNLMSGVFLIFEKPFVVGDIIKVNDIFAEVLSIDLLSMTLRSVDNLMVRLPNDLVMSTPVFNYSYFPIRRLDLKLQIPYHENLESIHRILNETAEKNNRALDEPEALFLVEAFTDHYIEVLFSVWLPRENFMEDQSELCKQIHRAFKNSGIEQPHTSVKLVPATSANIGAHP